MGRSRWRKRDHSTGEIDSGRERYRRNLYWERIRPGLEGEGLTVDTQSLYEEHYPYTSAEIDDALEIGSWEDGLLRKHSDTYVFLG